MKLYSKQDFLNAAKEGEVSMIDAEHIASLLDEVRKPVPLTESNIGALGFTKTNSCSKHCLCVNMYSNEKGVVVDFIYENDKLQYVEASVSGCNIPVNFEKLKALNIILNG